jgi:signal transduction histidine kinase/ligand-binding sensor domain-containing protein
MAVVLLATLGVVRADALDPHKGLSACTVDVFGMRDGLTGAAVRAIAQDSAGYLWIAAEHGLARYDGTRVVHAARADADPMGFALRPSGDLLVLPGSGPLLCIQGGRAEPCMPAPPALPPSTPVTAAYAEGDRLWLGADTDLFVFRGGALVERHSVEDVHAAEISTLGKDADGRFFVGGANGLFVETPHGFALWESDPGEPVTAHVRAMAPAVGGAVWVVTDGSLLHIGGGVTRTYALPPDGTYPQAALEDRDGNLWIGTPSRLLRFRDGHFSIFTEVDGLPDRDVTALYEDREGSLWIGTRSGSVAQFTDRTVETRTGPPSLQETSIETIAEQPAGTLWFATWRGLTSFATGAERTYTRADGLPTEHVFSVYPGRDGELWVGTEAGLARFKDGRFEKIGSGRVYLGRVLSLYVDADGTLWIGTDRGLACRRAGRVTWIRNAADVPTSAVHGIAADGDGTLWVTGDSGLLRVAGGVLVRYRDDAGRTAEAEHGFYRDERGVLWFGVGAELAALDHGRLRRFAFGEAASERIYQVQGDALGSLWLATNSGLVRVARSALGTGGRIPAPTFSLSDLRRLIEPRRSWTPGSWKATDGRLWFATLRGTASIDPSRARPSGPAPNVVIERLLADGRTARTDEPTIFPPGEGNVEIQFSALTLVEPRRARCRYRLDGFDADWVDAGPRREVRYTNLRPGRYVFRVEAGNADGVWNEEGAAFAFRLRPHFYQTWWFYALLAAAALAAVAGAHRSRLRRMRAQYVAVFAERNRLARELHDSLLQGMSASALELENVHGEMAPSATRDRLAVVHDVLTTSLAEARRFIWNLRGQPEGTDDLGVALTRLARRVGGDGIPCTVDVDGHPVRLSHDVQGALFRIAQEALVNAIKHSGARTVTIRLRYESAAVRLCVADDGSGFDLAHAPGPAEGHFGLVGLRERAARLGGETVIDTNRQGTTIDVVVPFGVGRRDA